MSDLIQSVNWEDFKTIVDAGKVKELKSCEILCPEHDFNVVIFHGDTFSRDYARTQSEYLALRTNTVSGKGAEELLAEIKEEQNCNDPYPNLTKARSARKAKREKVRV